MTPPYEQSGANIAFWTLFGLFAVGDYLVVFFVGVRLAVSNWASLIVLALVPTAGRFVRIHSEERALIAGWARTTGATPPRVVACSPVSGSG